MKIGLVAGEPSSDFLGADLLRRLKKTGVEFEAVGVGGALMEKEGLQRLADIDELSIMGVPSASEIWRALRLRRRIIKQLRKQGVEAFIGIDSSSFNLRIAYKLKKRGIPTAQYVSPSVWAWRRWRVKSIEKSVDQVFCLFPFELWPYDGTTINTHCVGHPFVESMQKLTGNAAPEKDKSRADAFKRLKISKDKGKVVALLPGSRQQELRRHVDLYGEIAAELEERGYQPIHAPVAKLDYEPRAGKVIPGAMEDVLKIADAALVCSGTATLTTALMNVPQVVVYRAGFIHYLLTRLLAPANPPISLPNLLTGIDIVPEFRNPKGSEDVLSELLSILENPERQLGPLDNIHSALADHEDLGVVVSDWLELAP